MTFVVVRHEIFVGGEVALNEEHDIVYRGGCGARRRRARLPSAPGEEAEFRRTVAPGAVELFLYSALTYNGHRIHYDRDYATRVEALSRPRRARTVDRDASDRQPSALEARRGPGAIRVSRTFAAFRGPAVRSLRSADPEWRTAMGAGRGGADCDGGRGRVLTAVAAARLEPLRIGRRLFRLTHAAMAGLSSIAE